MEQLWISKKYNVKFLIYFSAKCGNTSLRKWFMNFEYGIDINNICNVRLITDIIRETYNNINYNEFKKIILVRNPYDRCISMFIDKFIFKQDTIYQSLSSDDITFNTFIDLLLTQKDNNFRDTNEHFIPQIINRYDIQFDYIIKLENIQNDMMEFINKELELKEYVYTFKPEYNFKSNYDDKYINNLCNLKLSELSKYKSFNKKLFLTDENKAKIYNIYKDDFIYFNYMQ